MKFEEVLTDVDPFDPKNYEKPLWVVYGESRFWPQLLCVKIYGYNESWKLDPTGKNPCIWGYSVFRGKAGFRTLGLGVRDWSDRQKWGPYFFDNQDLALEYLKQVTTPDPLQRQSKGNNNG